MRAEDRLLVVGQVHLEGPRGLAGEPQAVEVFGPQPAVLELDVRAAERAEREGDQGGCGIAPARALVEVEPHRLCRPARERATEDAKAHAPDDQPREVADVLTVVHDHRHDGLRALRAREELQPLARLEDDPVPERVHALPVGAGRRDPLERQRHRAAVRTALAAARGSEGRR